MSDDPLRDHLAGSFAPVRESERQPATTARPLDDGPRAERFVTGPNRRFEPTGYFVGRVKAPPGTPGNSSPKTASAASSNPEGGAGSEGAPAAEEVVSAASAAEESQEASQMAADIAQMQEIASDPEIQACIGKVMDGIARDLVVLEEPEAVDAAMGDWLNALTEGKAPTPGQHPYQLEKWRHHFERQGNFKNVESFATAMHKAGASPEAVDSMLRRFVDFRASVTSGPLSRTIMRKRRESE